MKDFVKALGDYPDLQPWQEDILNKFAKGDKEIKIMTAGRGVGKSLYSQVAMQRLMDDLINRPIEELICSEGTIFGKRYLTAEPIGGNWIEMEKWATETFGPPASVWEAFKESDELGRWYMNDRRFWFLDDKDRTLFLLKWR